MTKIWLTNSSWTQRLHLRFQLRCPYNYSRTRLHRRPGTASNRTRLFCRRLPHLLPGLPGRQAPESVAIYYNRLQYFPYRLHRSSLHPPPTPARPHLFLPLLRPGRPLSRCDRRHLLGWQQPCPFVQTSHWHGPAHDSGEPRRCYWLQHLPSEAGATLLAGLRVLSGHPGGGNGVCIHSSFRHPFYQQEAGPDVGGGSVG